MGSRTATLTGGQGSRANGVVSGFVLKLARQSAALTQERLAEVLAVDVTTVQGWESGRRPLAAMNAGDFLHLSSRLSRLGAPASTGRHLREAVEADVVLSVGIAAGDRSIDGETHPLAAGVHRRTLANLITWPITELAPEHLTVFARATARRGPVPACPVLSVEERTRFLDHLRAMVERCTREDDALLRRQAAYLLGFDDRPRVAEWLRTESNRAGRRSPSSDDVAGLLHLRSTSVALASAGDGSRLYDFVKHMSDGRVETVNLNYWAYWIGEIHDEQAGDAFMLDYDPRSWVGMRLMEHLASRLDPDAAHLPLDLHTLHALIASRPSLLHGKPAVLATLAVKLDELSSVDGLTRTIRDQACAMQYALRIADR